jgi:hypothetical protein
VSDRELLELAAKAAGIDYHATREDGTKCIHDGRGYWNPLTDDGDALRLAVKLRMRVDMAEGDEWICVNNWATEYYLAVTDPYATDPYAATRRAITRAAAEIGRNMK